MDSRELTEWMAFDRYFQPLDHSWAQAGLVTSAIYAPHIKPAHRPQATDFIPVERAPQHRTQMQLVLEQMKRDIESA